MLPAGLQFVVLGMLLAASAGAQVSNDLTQGLDEARSGNCEAAKGHLMKALRENPGEAQTFTALGICESQLGQPAEATKDFEAAAKLQPKAWQAWNNLGANYLVLGRFDSATAAFHKAIQSNDQAVSAWVNLGLSLSRSGNKVEAFHALDRAQQLDPRDNRITAGWLEAAGAVATDAAAAIDKDEYLSAYTMLHAVERPLHGSASWNNLIGYAAFKLKKQDEAKTHLEAALQIEPNNESYLLDVGEFLSAYQAHNEATEFFEVGVKRMPGSPRVWFGLAVSYMLQDRPQQALPILAKLQSEHPDWLPVERALGECYESEMMWPDMIQLGRQMQRQAPGNPFGWYLEGAGKERLATADNGALEPAMRLLQHAVTLDPDSSRYRLKLGKTLDENRQYPEAVQQFKEAVRLDPQDSNAHYSLARAYKQVGDTKLAAQEFAIVSGMKAKSAHDVYLALLNEVQHSSPPSSEKTQR